jgi:hypothetical protein
VDFSVLSDEFAFSVEDKRGIVVFLIRSFLWDTTANDVNVMLFGLLG